MKKIQQYYLVINLGLRSIRTILFDNRANIVSKNWYPVQTIIHKDKVEQNPDEWWMLCKKLFHELFDDNEDYRLNIKTISVTSSASCLVTLDEKGKPVLNSFLVSDKRSQKEAEKIARVKSLKRIFRNPNSLAVPSYMFPKILWIKKNLPKKFKKIRHYISSNDFLIYKLTGSFITDPLNAEKFYYDPKTGRYPKEILSYTGLNEKNFSNVTKIGSSLGQLLPDIQNEFGLSKNTTVILSTYDAICAFIGSGVASEGDTCNVSGTVGSVRVLTNKKIKGKYGILSQHCNDYRIVGGSNNIDGGLLEWSKNMFYGDTYPDKHVYTIMQEEAENSTLGAHGLLFLPYIVGERIPFFDNLVRGIFFGLERFHTRSDIMRSIYESSSFMTLDIIQHIEKLGVKVKKIHMSGGLTQSDIACKIRANVTGRRVLVNQDLETTAIGSLFIMLVSEGLFKNLKHAAKLVKYNKIYNPDPRAHEKYKRLFLMFKKIYTSNKILMEERQNILQNNQITKHHVLENL